MPNATSCPHTDRPMKARGLCKSCWSREQRAGWKKPAAIASTAIPGGIAGKPGKVKPAKAAAAKPAPVAIPHQDPDIATVGPDRIRVTLTAIGSTDATANATKAARAAGHKVKTIALVGGGTPGSKVREAWWVDLVVKPAPAPAPALIDTDLVDIDPGPGVTLSPGDGVGTVQVEAEALPDDTAPSYGPGQAPCPDCGEPVSKANLARHRKRRHSA